MAMAAKVSSEPIENISANFCGRIGSSGRKVSAIEKQPIPAIIRMTKYFILCSSHRIVQLRQLWWMAGRGGGGGGGGSEGRELIEV